MIGPDAVSQGVEIERLEGFSGIDPGAVMGHEQLAVDRVDVGLDTAESVLESIDQGARMLVVVVAVGAGEGRGGGLVGRVRPEQTACQQCGEKRVHGADDLADGLGSRSPSSEGGAAKPRTPECGALTSLQICAPVSCRDAPHDKSEMRRRARCFKSRGNRSCCARAVLSWEGVIGE